jgi:hypothetical protein
MEIHPHALQCTEKHARSPVFAAMQHNLLAICGSFSHAEPAVL